MPVASDPVKHQVPWLCRANPERIRFSTDHFDAGKRMKMNVNDEISVCTSFSKKRNDRSFRCEVSIAPLFLR